MDIKSLQPRIAPRLSLLLTPLHKQPKITGVSQVIFTCTNYSQITESSPDLTITLVDGAVLHIPLGYIADAVASEDFVSNVDVAMAFPLSFDGTNALTTWLTAHGLVGGNYPMTNKFWVYSAANTILAATGVTGVISASTDPSLIHTCSIDPAFYWSSGDQAVIVTLDSTEMQSWTGSMDYGAAPDALTHHRSYLEASAEQADWLDYTSGLVALNTTYYYKIKADAPGYTHYEATGTFETGA